MPAKQWSHGDIPTGADMQAYSDALDALYASTPAYNSAPAVLLLTSPIPGSTTVTFLDQGCFFRLRHVNRFLHYKGAGTLVDVTGIEDDVTLPVDSSGYGVIDLDSIAWMTYGLLYQVEGCEGIIELAEG